MAGDIAHRDQNFVPTMLVASNANDGALVELWGDPTTHRLLCDVSITNVTVAGGKSNNAAVPGATNLGVLPAVATAAAPSYTEGYQVGLSTDLAGALRVTGSLSVGGTTDNSAYTADTSTGTPAFGFYHSTIDAITDGRSGALAMDSKRSLHTVIRDAAGNARGLNIDASGQIAVTLAAGQTLATVTTVGTVTTVSTVTAVTTVSTVTNLAQLGGAAVPIGAGLEATAIRVTLPTDGTGVVKLGSGTNGIGKLTSNSGVVIGSVEIAAAQTLATVTTVSTLTGGGVAHDSADSGNPIKVGGRAISAEIAPVANNDRSDFVTDLTGKQIVMPYSNPENFVSGAITTAMTGTTSTSLVAAPGAGLRNYITTIIVSNAHATVGTDVIIQDGSGGTTLLTIPAAAVYGGAVITLPVPLRQPTTNTAIYCANVTTGASTKVSAVGYKGA